MSERIQASIVLRGSATEITAKVAPAFYEGAGTPRATPHGMPTSQKKLEELDALIDGIETAMFTTRRHDGHLVSRPMATQERIREADLWFVTDSDAHKLDDLLMDPHVNCSYYNMKSREWVSVSGVARISRD